MRPAPSRRWARATYVTSCAAFAGALGALAAQVHAGTDPAIGAVAAAPPPRPRIIVTRKIVKTTVITKRIVRRPKPAPVAAATPYAGAAYAPAASYAPTAAAPAPAAVRSAPSAPVSAPAPAPAPAPAAPVTRGS